MVNNLGRSGLVLEFLGYRYGLEYCKYKISRTGLAHLLNRLKPSTAQPSPAQMYAWAIFSWAWLSQIGPTHCTSLFWVGLYKNMWGYPRCKQKTIQSKVLRNLVNIVTVWLKNSPNQTLTVKPFQIIYGSNQIGYPIYHNQFGISNFKKKK